VFILIIDEPIYNFNVLAKHNLHIHSIYSGCAKPEMIVSNILECARNSKIQTIAFTDHYNSKDTKILDNNNNLKKQAQECDTDINVLYGAELSAYGIGKYLDDICVNQQLDYRLYSYNHYHLDYWEHPEDKTPRGYVNHGLQLLEHLLKSRRADCIAHPFIGRFIRCFNDRTLVTKEIRDNELGDILELGMKYEVAWELNVNSIIADPEFGKRYWKIGKEVGVIFHMGTDAHRLQYIDTLQYLDIIRKILSE
jgi:histidinol phosphatase-like PHP family hydrolase